MKSCILLKGCFSEDICYCAIRLLLYEDGAVLFDDPRLFRGDIAKRISKESCVVEAY